MAAGRWTTTPDQLFERRQRVAQLYLQCESMAEIGRQIGVSAVTIYKDICWAREQWRTKAADAIATAKQRELARIDALEVEAWRGWQRSCQLEVIERTKSGNRPGDQGGPYDEQSTERRKQAGDPRFLDVIGKCIESRRKILGLDAPVEIHDDRPMRFVIEGLSGAAWLPPALPAPSKPIGDNGDGHSSS